MLCHVHLYNKRVKYLIDEIFDAFWLKKYLDKPKHFEYNVLSLCKFLSFH